MKGFTFATTLGLIALVAISIAFNSLAQETNPITTNALTTAPASTNASPHYTPEQMRAAKQVWHTFLMFAALVLIGGTVGAGFALTAAYRKYGVRGVIVGAIVIGAGILVLGGFFLLF